MLNARGYLDFLNDKGRKVPEFINNWRRLYYELSLHIDGVKPFYRTLRVGATTWTDGNFNVIYPTNYRGAEYQNIFENKLFSRHPRESESTRQWRLSQYKPFTKAPFLEVIQVITGAIFQDSGYSINLEDKDDNDFIWGNNFQGKSLVGFVQSKFKAIAEDPNALFVVIPNEAWFETSTKRVEPGIHFIPSKQILYVGRDEVIFEHGGYTWCVNERVYFRYIKREDGTYFHVDEDNGGYYAHMIGKLPVFAAGGEWNEQGYHDSWLDAALAVADEFVGSKSAEQLVNKEASHPWIVAASEDCPDCTGGHVTNTCSRCNGNDTESCTLCAGQGLIMQGCSTCNGKGQISRSPGQWQIVPIEDMDKDTIKIVSPSVEINKFHKENNRDLYNDMLRALHLNFIDEAQSGVAKDKDMETRYQFILRISNDLFDRLITGFIDAITSLRNVTVSNGVTKPTRGNYTIIKPTQFQIKTERDLLEEYRESTEAKVPDWVRAAQVEDYVDKLYGGDDVLKRKTQLINQMDIVALKSEGDKSVMVLNNAITTRDWQFSANLASILDRIIREKGSQWFVSSSYDDIKALVDVYFAELKPPLSAIQNIDERVIL